MTEREEIELEAVKLYPLKENSPAIAQRLAHVRAALEERERWRLVAELVGADKAKMDALVVLVEKAKEHCRVSLPNTIKLENDKQMAHYRCYQILKRALLKYKKA